MKKFCLAVLAIAVCLSSGCGPAQTAACSQSEPAQMQAAPAEQEAPQLSAGDADPTVTEAPAETGTVVEVPGENEEEPAETTAPAQTEAPAEGDTETADSLEAPNENVSYEPGPGEKAVTFSDIEIPYMSWKGITRLCQQDSRWASQRYSRNNVGLGGCGLVSLSRAMTYALGEEISPLDLIDMKTPYGLQYRYASTLGTDSTLFKDWAGQLGVSTLRTSNSNVARYEMETKGAVAITNVKGGFLSKAGHYILLVELTDDQAILLDPTIEGIMRTPGGVVKNITVTGYASEYILVYPEGTEVPSQDEFWSYSLNLAQAPEEYDKTAKAMAEGEKTWKEASEAKAATSAEEEAV